MSDIKDTTGKAPLGELPLFAMRGVARAFEYGCRKYSRGNFLGCDPAAAVEKYVGATLRHLSDVQGITPGGIPGALDDESGLPHIDMAIASMLMLRGILQHGGVLSSDPGQAKEPPVVPGKVRK